MAEMQGQRVVKKMLVPAPYLLLLVLEKNETTHHLGTKIAKANNHLATSWEIRSLQRSSWGGAPVFKRVKYFDIEVFKACLQREEGGFYSGSIA